MYNKKGIEITFSWVFSIIAGTLIFLFFVGFAADNMDLFGKLTAIRVSEELNSAFSGLKTGLVSTSLSFDKEIKLQFKCIGEKKEKLIVGYRSGKNLYDNVVFSPETLEGNEFLLMTKSWNVPYKVDNFIFISDKNNRYYLDNSPSELVDNLPSDFQNLIETDSSKKLSSYKIINFVHTNCENTVNGNEININYGYDTNGQIYGNVCGKEWGPLDFYGDAMVYAAIFGDQFNCLYPLMEEKLRIMRDVYVEKAKKVGANNIMITDIRELAEIKNIFNNYETVKTQNEAWIGEGKNAVF